MFIAIILAISMAVSTASGTHPAKPAASFKAPHINAVHTTGEYVKLAEYTCGEGAVARQTTKHCEQ